MKKINLLFRLAIFGSILMFIYLVFVGRNQYLYNISYVKCILLLLIPCLLTFLYGNLENKEKIHKRNLNIYIILYFLLLTAVTFIIGRPKLKFYTWWYKGNYIPFYTITSQLKYGTVYSMMKNLIGNSVMLIPLSFLLMIKDKKYNNIFKQMIIVLPVIVMIELLQMFTHTGSFDIDDIILNYAGTVIFTFLVTRISMIDKIRTVFYHDYIKNNQSKIVLFNFTLGVLTIFYLIIILKLI